MPIVLKFFDFLNFGWIGLVAGVEHKMRTVVYIASMIIKKEPALYLRTT